MSTNAHPLVSIIVVTYNSEKYIKKCVSSILSSSFTDFELILFDNDSSDKTQKILSSFSDPRIKTHFSTKNLGYAGGNNAAVRLSTGNYLCILNPDVIIHKNCISPLVSTLENDSSIAACQPLVFFYDGKKINLTGITPQFLGFNNLNNFDTKKVPDAKNILAFSGSGFMIRREVFQKVKGFDEQYFMYFEDSDLSWRIILMGHTIRFIPESTLRHDYTYQPNNSSHSMQRKLFFYERNRLLTLFKNYSNKVLFLIAPALFITELGMIGKSLIEGWLGTKMRSYASAIQLIPHILRMRKSTSQYRALSDQELFALFDDEIKFKKFLNKGVTTLLNPFLKRYFAAVTWILRIPA